MASSLGPLVQWTRLRKQIWEFDECQKSTIRELFKLPSIMLPNIEGGSWLGYFYSTLQQADGLDQFIQHWRTLYLGLENISWPWKLDSVWSWSRKYKCARQVKSFVLRQHRYSMPSSRRAQCSQDPSSVRIKHSASPFCYMGSLLDVRCAPPGD